MNSEDQMTVGLHNGGSASGQPSTKSKMANPFAVNFSLIFIGASETPTVELIDFLRSPPLATLDAWKESLARLLPAGSLPNASMGYRVQVIPGLNTSASYASILFKLKELITSNTLIIIEPQAYEAAKQLAREIRVHKIINPLVALSPLRLNQTGWRNAAISLLYNGADRFISRGCRS